jgi:hypothetical protein
MSQRKFLLVFYRVQVRNVDATVSVSTTDLNRNLPNKTLADIKCVGRGSVVVIATRYGRDGKGIENRRRRGLGQLSRPTLGPTQTPVKCVSDLLPRLKWPGRGFDHSTTSSSEVKERIEFYSYTPSEPSWPIIG